MVSFTPLFQQQEILKLQKEIETVIEEISTLKASPQKDKKSAYELQPYSGLLVDYVDSKGKSVSWQNFGIMIRVPPGSTPGDNPVVCVQAQCFLLGPDSVVLPENVQLASPVYKISATSRFSKKVELSIAHFATMDSKDDMTFLHSSDRSPPYRFQLVPGGTFIQHGTCGSLWLNRFCKFAAGKWTRKPLEHGKSTPKPVKCQHHEGIICVPVYTYCMCMYIIVNDDIFSHRKFLQIWCLLFLATGRVTAPLQACCVQCFTLPPCIYTGRCSTYYASIIMYSEEAMIVYLSVDLHTHDVYFR